MYQWSNIKDGASTSSASTNNGLSKADGAANVSYSTGMPRTSQQQQQQQQQQQVSAPFSLAPASPLADTYSASVYSVIDQIVREAMGNDEMNTTVSFPQSDSDATALNSPLNVTPRSPESARQSSSHQLLQQQQQLSSSLYQPPQHLSSFTNNTASWLSAASPLQHSSSVTEASLGPNTAYTSFTDNAAAQAPWQTLSKQTSNPPRLTSPVASVTALPHPPAVMMMPTVISPHRPLSASTTDQRSGTSTPGQHHPPHHQSYSQSQSQSQSQSGPTHATQAEMASSQTSTTTNSHSHGNTEVVLTGAVPAGAQPSSNAATHYKTKRCRHFDQSGWCPYQHRCVFAHGDREFALYTARKNEASANAHPKTSQQVKDHIARNVNQLVEEYEQAVAEAAMHAKAKSAANASGSQMNTSSLTMVTKLTSAQTASQVSSAASQHSTTVQMIATSPLASANTMASQSANASGTVPLFHYQAPQHLQQQQQQPQQQQQQYTVLSQQPVFISANNSSGAQNTPLHFTGAGAPPGTTFTLLQTAGPAQSAPQSLYLASQPPPQPPQHLQQQQQQQQQIIFALPSNAQGIYHLQPQQQPQQHHQQHQYPPQQQQPSHQQQQIYVVEAPYFQTVQMRGSNPNNAVMQQQTQSSGALQAFPSSYLNANGSPFGSNTVVGHYS